MSMLRSAIDELRLVDPDDLSLDEVSSELVELTRAASSLDAVRLKLLAAFDHRGGHELDGLCVRDLLAEGPVPSSRWDGVLAGAGSQSSGGDARNRSRIR